MENGEVKGKSRKLDVKQKAPHVKKTTDLDAHADVGSKDQFKPKESMLRSDSYQDGSVANIKIDGPRSEYHSEGAEASLSDHGLEGLQARLEELLITKDDSNGAAEPAEPYAGGLRTLPESKIMSRSRFNEPRFKTILFLDWLFKKAS